MLPQRVVDDAARAVLEGTPVDWDELAASADGEARALVGELKILSKVARLHQSDSLAGTTVPPRRQAPIGLGAWGHLQLLEHVGSGAFGDVYRAWDTRLAREVALKLLPAGPAPAGDPSPVIHEGRLAARVRHPNVAAIHGADLIDGRIGLWMEFVDGRTLEQLLQSGHTFDVADVVRIGRSLAAAVGAVHAAGLLHRDIKTQNVILEDTGRVVLTDFGTSQDRRHESAAGAGTPLYLAPEVLAGGPATVRSDIYSLGVVLFRLLTGGHPVRATSLDALRRAHAAGDRVDVATARPGLAPRLAAIVRRATDADPAQRYDGCVTLAADLERVAQGPARRRVAAALAAAAALGAVAWLAWPATGPAGTGREGLARAGLAGPAGVTAPARTIAVLPFRNLRPEPDSDRVVDGLTYEMIRSLAIIDGLDVRSATSSFAFKDEPRDLDEVRRRLEVGLVLEGSLQGSGDEWRFHVQLVDTARDRPVWSRRFDGRGRDMLAVQDDVALAVANELRLTVGAGQRRYDLDSETTALYLQARTIAERRGTSNATLAADLFQQVIRRDPQFAPAWAGLADAYAFMSQDLPDVRGLPYEEAQPLIRAAAEQALRLDPMLAESHAAMGFLQAREFDWDEAIGSFRRAIDLNPALTHAYTTYSLTTLVPLGRFDEARTLLADAVRRDPLSSSAWRELAFVELTDGRYAEAIEHARHAQTLDVNQAYTAQIVARAQTLAGRVDEALPFWEAGRDEIGRQHWMAAAFVQAGRRAEVERWAAEHTSAYRLVLIHAALGDIPRAMDALERAADEAPHRVVRLLQYPELAALRQQPGFSAVRAKFRLR